VPLVVPEVEVAARSCYELPAARCRVEFHVGGEARPPVALASMTAKYLRELAMIAFNEEWSRRVPGLAPTAGYPVDAARWRREAAAAVDRAGLRWDDLWRRA
jgi:ribonuclease HII